MTKGYQPQRSFKVFLNPIEEQISHVDYFKEKYIKEKYNKILLEIKLEATERWLREAENVIHDMLVKNKYELEKTASFLQQKDMTSLSSSNKLSAKSTSPCHLCKSKKFKYVECGNNQILAFDKKPLCKNAICQKCFMLNEWNWQDALNDQKWVCTHCRNECPEESRCNRERLINETLEEQIYSDVLDFNDDSCSKCGELGEFLCCDGCPAVFHLNCCDPPLIKVPIGDWFCPECQRERILNTGDPEIPIHLQNYRPVVLSLFDGIGATYVALNELGIIPLAYYSSEINQDAIKVLKNSWQDKIIHLHDVRTITKESISHEKIDIIIGGSPCQNLSRLGQREGLVEGRQSSLFFEFVRLLQLFKPTYFFFENVASMEPADKAIINSVLQVESIEIDAALLSAGHRKRLYWTNMKIKRLPNANVGPYLNDLLLDEVKSEVKKARCITTNNFWPVINDGRFNVLWYKNGRRRGLHCVEAERILGFPDFYTDVIESKSKRWALLGNTFSVFVLKFMFCSLLDPATRPTSSVTVNEDYATIFQHIIAKNIKSRSMDKPAIGLLIESSNKQALDVQDILCDLKSNRAYSTADLLIDSKSANAAELYSQFQVDNQLNMQTKVLEVGNINLDLKKDIHISIGHENDILRETTESSTYLKRKNRLEQDEEEANEEYHPIPHPSIPLNHQNVAFLEATVEVLKAYGSLTCMEIISIASRRHCIHPDENTAIQLMTLVLHRLESMGRVHQENHIFSYISPEERCRNSSIADNLWHAQNTYMPNSLTHANKNEAIIIATSFRKANQPKSNKRSRKNNLIHNKHIATMINENEISDDNISPSGRESMINLTSPLQKKKKISSNNKMSSTGNHHIHFLVSNELQGGIKHDKIKSEKLSSSTDEIAITPVFKSFKKTTIPNEVEKSMKVDLPSTTFHTQRPSLQTSIPALAQPIRNNILLEKENLTTAKCELVAEEHDHDNVFLKKCSQCKVHTTPCWRRGPNGPATLCNMCGIKYFVKCRPNIPMTQTSEYHLKRATDKAIQSSSNMPKLYQFYKTRKDIPLHIWDSLNPSSSPSSKLK